MRASKTDIEHLFGAHKVRERNIERHLVKRVKELGGEVRKVKWIGRRGAPDRLVMLPAGEMQIPGGRLEWWDQTIWVELKAPGEKPTPAQAREHKRMQDMGQYVVVVDSIEGVERLLT